MKREGFNSCRDRPMYGKVWSPQSERLKRHSSPAEAGVLEAVHDRKSMKEGAARH